MTHSQWLFRCITKHHCTKGTLVLARKEDLLKENERQLDMGVDAIADEDRWMLEVDVDHIRDTSWRILRALKYLNSVRSKRYLSSNPFPPKCSITANVDVHERENVGRCRRSALPITSTLKPITVPTLLDNERSKTKKKRHKSHCTSSADALTMSLLESINEETPVDTVKGVPKVCLW